jgi:hypothetical protein
VEERCLVGFTPLMLGVCCVSENVSHCFQSALEAHGGLWSIGGHAKDAFL